jgi:NAD(P)-dependent dehydrogenase (short-subunit alcohol dehydrogenase family)
MSFNPLNLKGHSILVTGASSGIGRETSVLLSKLGARLVLVSRNAERLAETERLLEGPGHRVEAFDLTSLSEIPNWLKGLAAEVGPLSGLVHSAGTHFIRPLRVLTPESLDEAMRVNLGAAVALVKGFRQKNVRHSGGASVVLVASVMGLVGQAAVSAYAASKGALISLGKSLALELAGEGIRVNCVAPGLVKSEMTERFLASLTPEQAAAVEKMHPLGIGSPLDVAHAIAFLLAETGRWMTGTTMIVDGGYTSH